MKTSAFVLGLAVFCVSTTAWSAQSDEDAAAIRQRAESYVTAYNRHDAAAVADHWSEDAVYVNRDSGERIQGRTGIAAMFQTLFQDDTTSRLSVTIDSIRLITPEVAIEDGSAELVAADGEPSKSTYTAVHVKKGDTWLLDSVRETDTPRPPASEPGQLEQLAWMIGEWVDQDEDVIVHTRWEWTKNKHFLKGSFSVSTAEGVELEGTQVIGWDPAANHIRSWIFDSEGGFGEGVWRRVGNQWTSDSTSTLSDGSQATAVNVYTFIDDNTFHWKSVDRQVDGEAQADIDEVAVHRQQ
jgi:uncharacterized protein (TIGR02246 family)